MKSLKDITKADDESLQITLRISKSDLNLIDKVAKEMRITRAGLLRQAVFDFIDDREIATALKHRAHAL
jgi:predicted transcriptional regulator